MLNRCFPNPYPLYSPPQGFEAILEAYKARITAELERQMSEGITIENLTEEQKELFHKRYDMYPCSVRCYACKDMLTAMIKDGDFDVEPEPEPETTSRPLSLSGDDLNLIIVSLYEAIKVIDEQIDTKELSGESADIFDLSCVHMIDELIELRNRLIETAKSVKGSN